MSVDYSNINYRKNQLIECRLSYSTKTIIKGRIQTAIFNVPKLWIEPIRIDGKFIKKENRTILCIHKRMITKITL